MTSCCRQASNSAKIHRHRWCLWLWNHLPEEGYDDFAGLDVHGAVWFIERWPESIAGTQRAHALAEVLPRYLESAGAVVSCRLSLRKIGGSWARQKAAGTQPGMVLAEKTLRRYQGPMFGAAFDETKAEMLFEGAGKKFAELVALADAHAPLPT